MKISVSLSDIDIATLDRYAARAGLPSRSAALRHAVEQLRTPVLESDYAAAWGEWSRSDDSVAWDATTADGLSDAQR